MSEYTPITGELRERIGQAEHIIPLSGDSKNTQVRINLAWLTEKLDAIDSIHAQLERENAALKAELDRVLGEQDNGAIMPLPKDMNDEPIHIGDVMEWPTTCETFEVVGIGDGVLFYVEDGNEKADWTGASTKRHHAPDTWERILADALGCEPYEVEGDDDLMAIVVRCKALCERTKEAEE